MKHTVGVGYLWTSSGVQHDVGAGVGVIPEVIMWNNNKFISNYTISNIIMHCMLTK